MHLSIYRRTHTHVKANYCVLIILGEQKEKSNQITHFFLLCIYLGVRTKMNKDEQRCSKMNIYFLPDIYRSSHVKTNFSGCAFLPCILWMLLFFLEQKPHTWMSYHWSHRIEQITQTRKSQCLHCDNSKDPSLGYRVSVIYEIYATMLLI